MSRIPSHISLLKTLRCRLFHTESKTAARNLFGVLLYGKVHAEFAENAKLVLNSGRLEVGKHWTKHAVYPSVLKLGKNARLLISGSFSFFDNSRIYVNENAVLEVGSGYMNSNANISCFEKISIGNNVVISENVSIRDSDNHTIVSADAANKRTAAITIGNDVWIGMNVTILKGVTIGNGSVIAAGAVVAADVPERCLVAGVPAKVIRTDVEWKR